jgi:protein-disulfide isomerase
LSRKQAFGMGLGFCAGLAVAGWLFLFGPGASSRVEASSTPPNGEQVVRYIRERFGVPDSEHLSLEPFREAAYPGYFQTTVVVDNGKDKRESHISVSADGRYLILSDFLPLGSDPKADIVRQVTEVFKVPPSVKLSVGPFLRSPYPSFLETTITATTPERTQKQKYFVTRDKHFLVLGGIFNMDVDPRRQALRTIKLADQPYVGSADAPVTIVEFADLECPTCAVEHRFLEQELMPKYGGKVRLVFKEFPLLQVHPWAFTAALACQCAYQIDPSKFVAYRTSIFDHQGNITATTARDLLLYYGQQVGLDRLKLASCLDSKASLPRVEEDLREGRELGVDRTPTFFINGRLLIGGGPPDAFYRHVDEALRASQ